MKNSNPLIPRIIITVLLVVSQHAFSQNDSKIIQGKILDSQSKQPLAYANIGISGTIYGTASNESGAFYLEVPAGYSDKSLIVSYLGYKSYSQLVSDLDIKKSVLILLEEQNRELEEVIVTSKKLTGKKIIQKTIRGFKKNYPNIKFELRAYFRSHVFNPWEENPYLDLTELIVKVQDQGYHTGPDSSVVMEILKQRKGRDYLPEMSFSDSLVLTNMLQLLTGKENFNELYRTYASDVVRNIPASFFSASPFREDAILNEELTLEGLVRLEDRLCYKVSSKYKDNYQTQLTKKNKAALNEKYKNFFPENTPRKLKDSLITYFETRINQANRKESVAFDRFYIDMETFALLRYEKEEFFSGTLYKDWIQYQKVGKKYLPKSIYSVHPELLRGVRAPTELNFKLPYRVSYLVVNDVKTSRIQKISKDKVLKSDDYLQKINLPYKPEEWVLETQIPFDIAIYSKTRELIESHYSNLKK